MKKKIFLLALFSVLVSGTTRAQTWSAVGSGMNYDVKSFTIYNNELYAGGLFITAGGVSANHIAKWNGSSWSAVGGGISGVVTALAVYNNELYAGGDGLAKWNGSSWSDVGGGIGVGFSGVYALSVYNNELYVGGGISTAGGVPVHGIAKWNGSSWSDVGGGMLLAQGPGTVYALSVYNNELIAAGIFLTAGGIISQHIAKWNGSAWSSVGGGLDERVYALTVYNNELYAGGYFGSYGGTIAKWNGSSWSDVGGGIEDGYAGVFAFSVYNNELYVGGEFESVGAVVGAVPANNIAKWDGSSWSDVGGGTNCCWVSELGSFNGSLYMGGSFTTAGGVSANYIAKWSNCNTPVQPNLVTGNSAVCSNSTQLYSISPVSGATSYTWILPSGWTGTSTTDSIAATVGVNSGNISVTANNSCGNSSAQALAVIVISNPAQPSPITGTNPACKGSSQTYSVNAVSGATSYTWILPTGWTGTSTTNSITATVGSNSGNISVTANNSCDHSSPQSSLMVTVNADPVQPGLINGNVMVNVGQTFNYSVNTVGNTTGYNWSLNSGGNIISGQNTTSISVNWLTTGNYSLSVSTKNSCGASNNQILNVTVIDPVNPFQVKITPNPSPGDFYLTAKGVIDKKMHIEIFNLLGQKIYSDQQRAATNDYSMLLNLGKVASGVYVVKIIIDEKVYLRTIVKLG